MLKTGKAILMLSLVSLSACQAPLATIPARQVETQKITLGSVQSKIKVGVTNSEVIEVLGSPNIVTTNADKTETWVYDKVMSEVEKADGWSTEVKVSSTRTMIVTIKFDKEGKVRDVAYRQTSY